MPDAVIDYPIEVDGRTFRFTAVSMGNPHCVIYVEDAVNFDLAAWGPKLEAHPMFPRKINVEFATVRNRDCIRICGFGSGARAYACLRNGRLRDVGRLCLNGLSDREATVSLKGGDLLIEWKEADNHVYMTGPAEEVFTGIKALVKL